MPEPRPEATPPLRRGGRARLADGSTALWSVAEGRRGRRWRDAVTRTDGWAVSSLIEVDPDGRVARLEVSGPAGMLTAHPDADGLKLHGNVVDAAGVRPIALGWGPEHRLVAAGSLVVAAVACRGLPAVVSPGASTVLPGVAIDLDLRVVASEIRIERASASAWRLEAPGSSVSLGLDLDELGLPAGEASWSLEEADAS